LQRAVEQGQVYAIFPNGQVEKRHQGCGHYQAHAKSGNKAGHICGFVKDGFVKEVSDKGIHAVACPSHKKENDKQKETFFGNCFSLPLSEIIGQSNEAAQVKTAAARAKRELDTGGLK